MRVEDAATRAHRLALLAGLRLTLQRLDEAITMACEACNTLLEERKALRHQMAELEDAEREI